MTNTNPEYHIKNWHREANKTFKTSNPKNSEAEINTKTGAHNFPTVKPEQTKMEGKKNI